MEDEFYNLVVKGNDLKTYIRRFQELAALCPNMVPNSEKLIRGLPRSIKGNVTASKPQTLEEAITITQRLMEQSYGFVNGNHFIETDVGCPNTCHLSLANLLAFHSFSLSSPSFHESLIYSHSTSLKLET
ncbi:hypothetical protein Tco_1129454 [Tanacetum coccineum]